MRALQTCSLNSTSGAAPTFSYRPVAGCAAFFLKAAAFVFYSALHYVLN